MGRNLPEFRLGNLGGGGLNPKYVGPAALPSNNTQDRYAPNYGMRNPYVTNK